MSREATPKARAAAPKGPGAPPARAPSRTSKAKRPALLPDRAEGEQEASPFARILADLLRAAAGGRGAALVDSEGEAVDYVGTLDPYELKIMAAHWQIVLREIAESPPFAGTRQLVVANGRASFLVRAVQEGYCLVIALHPRAAFAVSERALREVDRRLAAEAGWAEPKEPLQWFGIEVESEAGDPARPRRVRVGETWFAVEVVMGAVVGLGRRERGFRVRLSNGAELSLVRERLGRWYADEGLTDVEQDESASPLA